MPWIEKTPPPGEMPARWVINSVDTCVDHTDLESIKSLRARYMREMTELKESQKYFGKQGDTETAKFFKQEVKEWLKIYRAYDLAVRFIEGDKKVYGWRSEDVSEEISPYLDRALIV